LIVSALAVPHLDQPDALPEEPAIGVATPTPDTQPPAFIVYTVQPGDTIGDLASAYRIALSSLLWSNPSIGDGDEVSPGQDLRIPLSDGVVYDVQSGDTLSSIAEQFDVDVGAIIGVRDNHLKSADSISVGQTIFVPGGSMTAPVPTPTATPEPPHSSPAPAPVATPPHHETPSADGAEVVATARAEIGTPYVSGGASPSGFDCSGLVYWVFTQLGYSVPRSATEQYAWTTPIDRSELEPGDLVFFTGTYSSSDWITHVGIYTGGGMVLQAVDNGDIVREISLNEPYWDAHYAAAGRPPY
jgi:peptidoglycan endopeptidase LytE